MKWYQHQNPEVVVLVKDDCCIYHEVANGRLVHTNSELRYYHTNWIEDGTWTSISSTEAGRILADLLGERAIEDSLSALFTQIDIHMFSSGEPNEL